MKKARRAVPLLLVVATSALAGTAVGGALPASAGGTVVGQDVHLGSPTVALANAQERYPYEVKKPRYLPRGMNLFNVLQTTPVDEGERAYSIDLFYRDAQDNYIHVWQTDNQTLAAADKDPSAPGEGESVVINNMVWQLVNRPDLGATILSVRYNDTITLSVDTNLSEETLRRIAESIS